MSESQLSILLTLRDEATQKIAQFSDTIQTEMNRAGESLKSLGTQISRAGVNMTFLGAVVTGPLALAFRTTANYSVEARESLKRLEDSAKNLQITIGESLAPVMDKISHVVAGLTQWFDSLDPSLRNMIFQGALMTGIFITMAGAITTVVGRIILLAGRLLILTSGEFVLLSIAAASIAIIASWEKIKVVVLPIINVIEYAIDALALSVHGLNLLFSEAFQGIARDAQMLFEFLAQAPGPQQGLFKYMASGAKNIADYFQNAAESSTQAIATIQNEMGKLASTLFTGPGALSSATNDVITQIQNLWNLLMHPPIAEFNTAMQNFQLNFQETFTKAYEQAMNLGQQTGQIIVGQIQSFSKGLGDAVANMLIYGKNFGESMKQVFTQMAVKFISSVIEMIAQWAIFQAVQAAFMPLMVGIAQTTASLLATIWSPVAAMVSLATMGANAGPAAAAIIGTTALAQSMAIPKLAEGGIITRPTIAFIGERGPEAVVPLNRGSGDVGGAPITIHNTFDFSGGTFMSEDIPEKLKDKLTQEISRRLNNEIGRIQ